MCLTVCLFVHQSVSRLKVCQLVNLSECFPRVCHCVCLFGNEPEIRCILSVFFSNLQIFRGMSKADSRKTRFYLFFVLTVLVFLSFVFCMHLSYNSKHFMLGRWSSLWTCGFKIKNEFRSIL